tara:strand:+ start:181 stop:429 length:249 start_codon:yes stop_codon:yes gene_type:complete
MSMKMDVVFDYSYEPFKCVMFVHEFGEVKLSDKNTYAGIKHSTFCFGVDPILINLTATSQWTTSLEIKLWKTSFTFSVRWWS